MSNRIRRGFGRIGKALAADSLVYVPGGASGGGQQTVVSVARDAPPRCPVSRRTRTATCRDRRQSCVPSEPPNTHVSMINGRRRNADVYE
jgi:hypothetical protein